MDEEDEKSVDSDPHLIVPALVSFPDPPAIAWE